MIKPKLTKPGITTDGRLYEIREYPIIIYTENQKPEHNPDTNYQSTRIERPELPIEILLEGLHTQNHGKNRYHLRLFPKNVSIKRSRIMQDLGLASRLGFDEEKTLIYRAIESKMSPIKLFHVFPVGDPATQQSLKEIMKKEYHAYLKFNAPQTEIDHWYPRMLLNRK